MPMCYNMCTDVDNTDMLYLDKDKKKKKKRKAKFCPKAC